MTTFTSNRVILRTDFDYSTDLFRGYSGCEYLFLLFVFSGIQMEQPRLHTKCPPLRGGCIAYRKICLLSRVLFSRSTLACKITFVNWLRAQGPFEHTTRNNRGQPQPYIHSVAAFKALEGTSFLVSFFFCVVVLLEEAWRQCRFTLWSQQQFTSETVLMVCLLMAPGYKHRGLIYELAQGFPHCF